MGNLASTARVGSAAAADLRVDAMEKQQQDSLWTRSAEWLKTTVASVKETVFGADAAPATTWDDCDLLAMARPDLWELCAGVVKDDDCESCTTDATDATDALTESESDDADSEDEQEADDDFFDAVGDAVCASALTACIVKDSTKDTKMEETSARDCECHCDALVDRLHRLAASPCSSTSRMLLFVDDFMCPCGDCPHAKRIALDVAASDLWTSAEHKRSLTRLLQAFATYNEVIGYDRSMMAAASECLHMWAGAEDHAFTSFVMLFE